MITKNITKNDNNNANIKMSTKNFNIKDDNVKNGVMKMLTQKISGTNA